MVVETPNIPFLSQFPVRQKLQDLLGCPVAIDNDANLFALGEAMAGAGKGVRFLLGVTLGTGFGWGIVLDGKVHHGATGTATEYGLAPVGSDGQTWEDTISARGVVSAYQALGGAADTPLEIAQAAEKGDPKARQAWEKYGHVLGLALSHGVGFFDPDVIVVGGAIAGAWEHFSPAMLEALYGHILDKPRAHLKILPAMLGADAQLYGAVSLVTAPPAP
jgi:glucokinase